MNAAVESQTFPPRPTRLLRVTPVVELGVLALAIAIAVASYAAISGNASSHRLIAPPLVALLLVINLVPGVALLMLLGRRIAKRRAAQSTLGGEAQLHVRLVALFSVMAAVPMLLVTIFASLLFQYGVQFWYSDRARGILEDSAAIAQSAYQQTIDRWDGETVTMADNLAETLQKVSIDDRAFGRYFGQQVYLRNLNEAAIYAVGSDGTIQSLAMVNPVVGDPAALISSQKLARLKTGDRSVVTTTNDRIQIVTRLPGTNDLYVYATRYTDLKGMRAQLNKVADVGNVYRALLGEARALQLRFNAALLAISLLIVGIAVWIALAVADRLVRPVAELVGAARRVESGDLTARVPETDTRDEVGTLSNAFNRMTERLESQNTALVTANAQLENRRALIEAVMSGVSAGVVSIAEDRTIRLINSSAEALLGTGGGSSIGRPLAMVAPELDALLDQPARDAVVQMTVAGEGRTLAVRIARDGTGPILTFDDITQQLNDQRRAAWSDVARRIAHEIKNPLTPIQLAAERLQRRYGKTIDPADTTFARLTDTIVRQVGDLRRMVDEFSSFARMPKPSFQQESLVDIARQTLFLHEVAHTGIAFSLIHDDPGPTLVCDRRQMGQALTNIVKNAVEAIEATGEAGGAITMTLAELPDRITIEVADNGVGLPVERDRIVEPYMTTRARGTGLGLAIVKKIVEEHCGTISFADRAEGGTVVCMVFDTQALAAIDTNDGAIADDLSGGGQLAALTRNRT